MAYTFVYVIFFEKSFCNVEDTDIDCSMCSTILPSGDSSGTTLEVHPRHFFTGRSYSAQLCKYQVFGGKIK